VVLLVLLGDDVNQQVAEMQRSGEKAEIETIGVAHTDGFLDMSWLCHKYIPHKLRTGGWI